MPNGSDRTTYHPLQELQSTKTVEDPEIRAWLALVTKRKKNGGGKKKKAKEEAFLVDKEEALGDKKDATSPAEKEKEGDSSVGGGEKEDYDDLWRLLESLKEYMRKRKEMQMVISV